ncbi:MAG: MBL fold metallo-hydrolase [Thermoprotei archaeon]|nr:MAG: MBL fold metallo-hydrolase [Thermoprotei archaeon]
MKLRMTILGLGKEIGRSAVLIEGNNNTFLLDYGVALGEKDEPELPLSIAPSKLTALIITHAHLDHVGAAPLLYISGKVPAIMTPLTRDISEIMIEDMLKISGYYLPFEHLELKNMLENTKPLGYYKELEMGSARIQLICSGHIPGSAMVKIIMGERSILYTGDVNTIDTRLVSSADLSNLEADTLIIEGTYGDVDHPERSSIEKKFIDTIIEILENGGTILIPAFSLGRSQEVLALLAEKLPYITVYYDGMVRRITEIMLSYKDYLNKPNLLEKAVKLFEPVRGWDMRKKIWREPCVIVAPAGMLKGGPSLYYIKRLWSNRNNAIILVSFQAPGTPGRMLIEEGTFMEKGPRITARLEWFDFSSHAGFSGLLKIVKCVRNLEKVIIVHSEEPSAKYLANRIREELGVDTYIPENGQVVEI